MSWRHSTGCEVHPCTCKDDAPAIAAALVVLTERRNYLTDRIAAKTKNGWDTVWDARERDALSLAIDVLCAGGELRVQEGTGGLVAGASAAASTEPGEAA